MKQLIRSKKIYNKNGQALRLCSGQALAELAIFAAILLFVLSLLVQYGLSFNHQQEERMKTFRKALTLASQQGTNGNAGHYVRINDRAVPNIQDESNVSEHYPFGSSASVLISNQLAGDRTPGTLSQLPRSYVEINGQMLQGAHGDYLLTGAWGEVNPPYQSTIQIKKALDISFGPGASYTWVTQGLTWREKGTNCYGGWSDCTCRNWDKMNVKPELVGAYADVDNDGREEQIVKVGEATGECVARGTWFCPEDAGECRVQYISNIQYLDYNTGDVDWADENQGYQPDYKKTLSVDASLERLENTASSTDAIVTTDKVTTEEEIEHKFVAQGTTLNPTFSDSVTKTTKWETPNE